MSHPVVHRKKSRFDTKSARISAYGAAGLVLAVILIVVPNSCARRHTSPPTVAPPEVVPPQPKTRSTVALTVLGTVTASGRAGVPTFPVPYSDTKLSDPNTSATITSGATGTENDVSCGGPEYHRSSRASGTSQVISRPNELTRTYGFGLALDLTAVGGFWKDHAILGFCADSRNTSAQSAGSARGEIHLSYAAPPGVRDRVIVRVSGPDAARTSVAVAKADGSAVPLIELGDGHGEVFELPAQGPYILTATLTNQINASGPSEAQANSSASISIQSLRDALSLGYGGDVTAGSFKLPLTIVVSPKDIEKQLRDALFTEGEDKHRFYPCRQKDSGCNQNYVYLDNPKVTTRGAWLIMDIHVGGSIIFFPIDADIELYGLPRLANGVLSMDQLDLQAVSSDWLTQKISDIFRQRMIDAVKAKAAFNYQKRLDTELAALNKLFPVRWGDATCILLEPTTVDFPELYVSRGSVNIDVSIGLKTLGADACAPKI